MALSSLFPKGFFDSPASTSAPSSSASSSSSSSPINPEDRLPGRDEDGKLKLPPVALYVSGAALALTVALTAMIVPYVKAAGPRTATPPSFISHVNVHRIPRPGRRPVALMDSGGTMVQLESKQKFSSSTSLSHPVASKTATSSIPPTSESTPLAEISKTVNAKTIEPAGAFSNLIRSIEIPDSLASEQLLANRRFNTSEERKLYGTSEADGEDAKNGAVDPLMGFYALAIATGIVGASTGLGVWVTARLMGVDNMDDFAKRVKEGLAKNMPTLVKVMDEAKEVERKDVGELDGDGVWKHWSETILGEERAKETKL